MRRRLKVGKYGPVEHSTLFWSKVYKTSTCWWWLDPCVISIGYGQLWIGRSVYAHRFSYELHKGPIPNGMTIDHLCKNPACVNPDHLEVVTMRENLLRGEGPAGKHARQTHCKRGHAFTPENTYTTTGHRVCRTCKVAETRQRRLAAQP